MHEFGVMTYLLQAVEEAAREEGARRVLAINLVIGDRATIVDDSMLFYFEAMKAGTLAEAAELKMRRVPSRFYCSRCDSTYVPGKDFCCPDCGALGMLTDEGSEFLIESIEIERE